MKRNPVLKAAKQLRKDVLSRVGEVDGNKGLYATDAEVLALRQLWVTLQHIFGMFAALDLNDEDE